MAILLSLGEINKNTQVIFYRNKTKITADQWD